MNKQIKEPLAKMEYEIRDLINSGKKIKSCSVENSSDGTGYLAVFTTPKGERFLVCTQKRADRNWGVREFRTIQAAISSIRRIGWKSTVQIAIN